MRRASLRSRRIFHETAYRNRDAAYRDTEGPARAPAGWPSGGELVLREPAPAVMRTLEMAGSADLLPVDLANRSII